MSITFGHVRPTQVLLVGILSAAIGCASPTNPSAPSKSDVSPAPAQASAVLTVRVLTRSSELPIAGARVDVSRTTTRTDASGSCTVPVNPGEMANVDVSAAGFLPLGASGVVMHDESWTFYLEPAANPS